MTDRILVVEDDRALGAQVVDHLRGAGYEPTWWTDGSAMIKGAPPEVALVVLDLMLPGVYGLDLLKVLRASSEVPVLVLSARNDTSDKVRALKLGADDYLTKPFWPEELIERVRARLRRPVMVRANTLRAGALCLDLASHEVTLDGRRIGLTRLECELLAALARRPGAPVTRDWLAEHVLDAEPESSARSLDVYVSRMRKKLGDPALIETVWGIGYRLSTERSG